jgi:hypothetical protein
LEGVDERECREKSKQARAYARKRKMERGEMEIEIDREKEIDQTTHVMRSANALRMREDE